MNYNIGDKVHVKVVKLAKYGAFADLGEGKWGLIHISEISDEYVKNIEDYLELGQEIEARILAIDKDGKIKLTIKKRSDREKQNKVEKEKPPEIKFEDKLDKFLKDSDDKISNIRDARIRKSRNKR